VFSGRNAWRLGSTAACAWTIFAADVLAFGLVLTALGILAGAGLGPAWSDSIASHPTSLSGSPLAATLLSAVAVLIGFGLISHYHKRTSWYAELQDIIVLDILGLLCNSALACLQTSTPDWAGIAVIWIAFPIMLLGMRHVARRCLDSAGHWQIRTVVIGPVDRARRVAATLAAEPRLGCSVVHVSWTAPSDAIHEPDAWKQLLSACNAQLLVLATGGAVTPHPHGIPDGFRREYASLVARPGLGTFSVAGGGPTAACNGNIAILSRSTIGSRSLARRLKVLLDWVLAISAVVFLAPIFCAIAIAVKLDGGPALYAHTRIGRGGRRFGCLKFRSMVTDSASVLQTLLRDDPEAAAEWEATQKLRSDPRVTRIGRMLRATSLDEIPQLFNVLRLEMSLVGPRPIVADEVARYGAEIAAYYAGRPGLTGLWQVSGRSDTSYAERVALDTHYVKTWSIWKDVSIIAKTIPAVLRRRGAC
jgi:undecaprenyl-phosphate galactose phosphotransferase